MRFFLLLYRLLSNLYRHRLRQPLVLSSLSTMSNIAEPQLHVTAVTPASPNTSPSRAFEAKPRGYPPVRVTVLQNQAYRLSLQTAVNWIRLIERVENTQGPFTQDGWSEISPQMREVAFILQHASAPTVKPKPKSSAADLPTKPNAPLSVVLDTQTAKLRDLVLQVSEGSEQEQVSAENDSDSSANAYRCFPQQDLQAGRE